MTTPPDQDEYEQWLREGKHRLSSRGPAPRNCPGCGHDFHPRGLCGVDVNDSDGSPASINSLCRCQRNMAVHLDLPTPPEPTVDRLNRLLKWSQHEKQCGRWTTIAGECSCGLNDATRLALTENQQLRDRLALAEQALVDAGHHEDRLRGAARKAVSSLGDPYHARAIELLAACLDETTPA